MVDLFRYFAFQCNKGRGMYYPLRGMMHIKEALLVIVKTLLCRAGSGFPLLLSEWFSTICPTLHCIKCVVK